MHILKLLILSTLFANPLIENLVFLIVTIITDLKKGEDAIEGIGAHNAGV